MHSRFKHWHLIDYIVARQRGLKDILHIRVMASAECHTADRLVRFKLKLYFKPKPRKGGPPRKSSSSASYSQLNWKLTFRQTCRLSLKTTGAQKIPLPKHSGINWKPPSCRHLKKFLGLTLKEIKTGSTKTAKRFRNCFRNCWRSCAEGYFSPHLQQPPAQASSDAKRMVDQPHS